MTERNLQDRESELADALPAVRAALPVFLRAAVAVLAVTAAFFLLVPAAQAADPVIAAAGDIACRKSDAVTSTTCRQQYTSDLLAGAAAVLPLGDLQYDTGLMGTSGAYGDTWGRSSVKSITHPVIGNHESRTDYYDYFNGAGQSNGPAGTRNNGWYSYDVGTWHLIALNSNCNPANSPQVSCAPGSPQEQWLRADLAANPNQCTLAYWHHPRFSNGHDGDNDFMEDVWRALYDSGADLVLSGHSHNYERFIPLGLNKASDPTRGIRQFVVGNGGAFFTGGGPSSGDTKSVVFQSDTYGVLKVALHPSSYDWEFVPEAGRAFTDSGSANCHHGASGGPSATGAALLDSGRTLSYVADSGQANDVNVSLSSGKYIITDAGIPSGQSMGDADGSGGCSIVAYNQASCSASAVTTIDLDVGDQDDTVVVNAADNVNVHGDGGADSITSGTGADMLDGGTGNDTLDADKGANVLLGGDGNDNLSTLDGVDWLDGGNGNDNLDAGAGNDTVNAGSGNNSLIGGDGNDTLSSQDGADSLDAGAGDDTLSAGAGSNSLTGGDGNDKLTSLGGTDWLDSGAGNDTLIGGAGDDTMIGGAGSDTADYSGAGSAVRVDLSLTAPQSTGGAGTDTLSDLENITGTSSSDRLVGNEAVNTILAGGGADLVYSRDSVKDTVNCGSGSGTDIASVDTQDTLTSCETIYNTPPNTTITSGPTAKTDATSATFKFTSSQSPNTFECSLDGNAWSVCASGVSYSSLDPGPHTFNVRALDQFGSPDPTPANSSWYVTAPPLASFTYSPTAPYVNDTVNFTSASSPLGAGNQISLHEWDLDGDGTFETNTGASPTASKAYPVAATITVAMRVTDANGKTAAATKLLTVVVRPPNTAKPGGPLSPNGPFGPVGTDRVAPKLTLKGSKSQRLVRRALEVTVNCDEPCTVTAFAKLGIGRASGLFRSKEAKQSLVAGAGKKLRLKFSGKALREIRAALAQKRRVIAKLIVQSNDAAGNLSSARRTIRLKR
jgi:acid phosphatase type 7